MQSRTFDGRDPATGSVPLGWQGRFSRPANIPSNYTQFLKADGLHGARLGVTRQGIDSAPPQVGAAFDAVLARMQAAGAVLIDLDAAGFQFPPAAGELFVLEFDFRGDVASYFATRTGVPLAHGTLQTAIDFNNANADAEMPFWGQDIFTQTASLPAGPNDPVTDSTLAAALGVAVGTTYNGALAIDQAATVGGVDAALSKFSLDAIVAPTDNPAWSTDLLYGDHFVYGSSGLGAPGGYPYIQVPASNVFGIPLGITFFGTAFSEPKLITLASGFEAVTRERARNLPKFTPTIPDDHIAGEPLNVGKHDKAEKPAGWHPRHM